MNIIAPFMPYPQPAEPVQSGPGSLYYPAVPAQPPTAIEHLPRYPWLYASAAKTFTQSLRVIGFVGVQLRRPLPRPAPESAGRLYSIKALEHHLRVMYVCAAHDCRERDAFMRF